MFGFAISIIIVHWSWANVAPMVVDAGIGPMPGISLMCALDSVGPMPGTFPEAICGCWH